MRLHGWCSECHRVRLVTARDVDAMLAVVRGGVAVGVCDPCRDAGEVDHRIAEYRRRPR